MMNTRTAYKFPTSHILINKSQALLSLACIFIFLYIPTIRPQPGSLRGTQHSYRKSLQFPISISKHGKNSAKAVRSKEKWEVIGLI